jgi:flavin-dependent dehydrogenase
VTDLSVAVLGTGPAGCAAARLLTSWGHDVTLIGRRASPDRSLGESIPPSCVALLDRVGFSGHDFFRSTGNTVRWGGEQRVEHFPRGSFGYQVDRAEFDAFVQRDLPITFADERPRARWTLDCTGRSGIIARDGWRRKEDATRTTAVIGVWEGDKWPTPDPTHTIVESIDDGWAWSIPTSATRRYVTLMLDPKVTPLARLEQAYTEKLARTRLDDLVRNARRVGPVFARDASPYFARSYGENGTLLVGDAGSFVDPLSSYGIKKALASAWLAAVAVHTALNDESMTTAALELFNARERAMYDSLRRRAASLRFWEEKEGDRREVVEITDPDPDIAVLRTDPDVLRAFDDLRTRDDMLLKGTSFVQRISRPTVRGNRVVVEDHLVVPAFPEGIRYIRNIDLLRLSELAPSYKELPDLFDAYNRVAPPAPIADFLGALSVLIGKGILEWS